VEPVGSAIIDFTEAAYGLDANSEDWLPKLLRAGAPLLDRGLGVFALTCHRPSEMGPLIIDRLHMQSGPSDLLERVVRLRAELDMQLLWALSRPSVPKTLSEAAADEQDPTAFSQIMHYFDFAKDGLGVSAFDPEGWGVYLIAPLPGVTRLTEKSRERWQMLAAHFGTGYRLRRAVVEANRTASTPEAFPYGAEAVIDPACFRVSDATGKAKSRGALSALRSAAVQIDRARGRLRERDPEEALELWKALVRGRWSAVDWFDSDGRRFVLAVPNAPSVTDPRGLTERETQVTAYALFGLSNKLIGYNLGLSKGHVSALMGSAMRKLGVSTRVQLVKRLRELGGVTTG
jgi:DNA-binding CsgD family transcriptional regulator